MTHVLAHTLITFYRNWFASSIDNESVTNIADYVTGMNGFSVSGWDVWSLMGFFLLVCFEIGSHYVALTGLKLRDPCLPVSTSRVQALKGWATIPSLWLSWQPLACDLRLKSCSPHVRSSVYTVSPSLIQLGICLLSTGVHVILPAPPHLASHF